MSAQSVKVKDHPLPPPTPDLVMATKDMFNSLQPGSFQPIPGFDPLDLRDLPHVAELTGGRVGVNIQKANPGTRWVGSPWHMHHLDLQYAYLISGSMLFEFEGVGVIELTAGTSIFQPPMNRHREFQMSEDFEAIMITMPAVFDTTFYVWDDEAGEFKTERTSTLDEGAMALQSVVTS